MYNWHNCNIYVPEIIDSNNQTQTTYTCTNGMLSDECCSIDSMNILACFKLLSILQVMSKLQLVKAFLYSVYYTQVHVLVIELELTLHAVLGCCNFSSEIIK